MIISSFTPHPSALLCAWNDDPQDHIGEKARKAAGEQQQEEDQAEPERADAKESPQATTNPADYPVLPS